jgi:xanthine phosphoribosyltransferase
MSEIDIFRKAIKLMSKERMTEIVQGVMAPINEIMDKQMNKRKIKYKEFKSLVGKICTDIENDDWSPDYILGITRGGLLPAVMISHYFALPCNTLQVQLRDGGGNVESNLYMAQDALGFNMEFPKNILIVDDINDSGATINWIINDWRNSCNSGDYRWDYVWGNNVRVAVVVDNKSSNSNISPNYHGMKIDKAENNVWIEFPYENWYENLLSEENK